MNYQIKPFGYVNDQELKLINAKTCIRLYIAAQKSDNWSIPLYSEQPAKDCRTCFHCSPNNGCERPSDVKCEKGSNHTPTETLELWK